jgi:hypothetical protein
MDDVYCDPQNDQRPLAHLCPYCGRFSYAFKAAGNASRCQFCNQVIPVSMHKKREIFFILYYILSFLMGVVVLRFSKPSQLVSGWIIGLSLGFSTVIHCILPSIWPAFLRFCMGGFRFSAMRPRWAMVALIIPTFFVFLAILSLSFKLNE